MKRIHRGVKCSLALPSEPCCSWPDAARSAALLHSEHRCRLGARVQVQTHARLVAGIRAGARGRPTPQVHLALAGCNAPKGLRTRAPHPRLSWYNDNPTIVITWQRYHGCAGYLTLRSQGCVLQMPPRTHLVADVGAGARGAAGVEEGLARGASRQPAVHLWQHMV